jgi:antitoxin MazE
MKRDPSPAAQDKAKTLELKVVRIGNSRGVRLPKAVLERYQITDALVLEARDEGLLLRGKKDARMTWAETYRDMARAKEDWSDLEGTVADGIEPGDKW